MMGGGWKSRARNRRAVVMGVRGRAECRTKEVNPSVDHRDVFQEASWSAVQMREASCKWATLCQELRSRHPSLVTKATLLSNDRRGSMKGRAPAAPRAARKCALR